MNRRGDGHERGAALIEMALALPLLVALLIGMAELGLGFRDWLSITTANRELVRVGSAAGDDPMADCLMLEAAAGALINVPIDDIQEVWIYQADLNGNPTGLMNKYRPGANVVDPADLLVCSAGWTKITGTNWDPTTRKVSSGDLDILGGRIIFDHQWITNFPPFVGVSTWTDDAIMRLEPEVFGP